MESTLSTIEEISLCSFCSSYLCRTASVPGFTLWIPSSSAMFPSRAAITRGEYRQLVSPLGSVIRCWRRSLAVMSCFIGRKKKRLIQGSYSFKFSKFHDFPWMKEWMNEYHWWITLFTQGDTLQLRTDKLVTLHDFFHDLFLVFHDLRFTYSCHLRKFSTLYLF